MSPSSIHAWALPCLSSCGSYACSLSYYELTYAIALSFLAGTAAVLQNLPLSLALTILGHALSWWYLSFAERTSGTEAPLELNSPPSLPHCMLFSVLTIIHYKRKLLWWGWRELLWSGDWKEVTIYCLIKNITMWSFIYKVILLGTIENR